VDGVWAQSGLTGTWTGSWTRDGDALAVTMYFKQDSGGWAGSFDSDRLRVTGIPLQDVSVTPPAVQWKIVGDATTMSFRGELRGGAISGEFDERGVRGTFTLERTGEAVAHTEERDLKFNNGEVVLGGTLLAPSPSGHNAPALVFLHGSGSEARSASKYLATRFVRAGFAALIFDKRGVGHSTGDWRTATPDDLAGDAAAAVEALRKSPGIDPGRIGIHGHSQGGALAPLVAAKVPNLAFVIASAAPGLQLDQVEIYSVENSIGVKALAPAEAALARAYVATLVATAYSGAPRKPLLDAWEKVREKPWAIEPPPEGSSYWSISRGFGAYDPVTYWRKVASPVLLVYGADDERVPPRASAARIMAALAEGAAESASVRILPHADHTLRLHSVGGWPSTPSGYPDILIEWARQAVGPAN